MIRGFRHLRKDTRHGTPVVETAFVLPVFLLFILGIIELGHALMSGASLAGDLPRVTQGEPVEGVEKYAVAEPDNYRQRMINNGLAFAFVLLLVAVGVWLADTIAEMRRNQDCVLSGRRNCAQVNVPPTGPNR